MVHFLPVSVCVDEPHSQLISALWVDCYYHSNRRINRKWLGSDGICLLQVLCAPPPSLPMVRWCAAHQLMDARAVTLLVTMATRTHLLSAVSCVRLRVGDGMETRSR